MSKAAHSILIERVENILRQPLLPYFLILLGGIIRYTLLSINSLRSILENRVELSNSFNSLSSVKELLFLSKELKSNVYDYGTCLPVLSVKFFFVLLILQMPLIVILTDFYISRGLEYAFIAICDCLSAFYLYNWTKKKFNSPDSLIPLAVMSLFLFNPLSFISGIAGNLSSVYNLSIIATLIHFFNEEWLLGLLFLSFSIYQSPHAIYLLAPLIITSPRSLIIRNISILSLLLLSLYFISLLVTGTWRFILNSTVDRLSYASLRPNVGLYWYLFIEMFDFFRPLFATFLQIHSLFYWIPVGIRFRKDPYFVTFLCLGLHSILQPYPTISDTGLYLSLLPLFPEIYKHLRFTKYCILTLLIPVALAHPIWYLWIHQGSGNANFYYSLTLIYNIPQVILLLDMMRAHLYTELIALNPTIKPSQIYQK